MRPGAASAASDWWEPVLPIASEEADEFNRCAYLRIVPATCAEHDPSPRHAPGHSPNAHLERAFDGQRMPAWGVHDRTIIVLMSVLAENAWGFGAEVANPSRETPAAPAPDTRMKNG